MSLIDDVAKQLREKYGNSRIPTVDEVFAAAYDPDTKSLKTTGGGGGSGSVETGTLATRPTAPDTTMVYVANDSSSPVSVWDGTQWTDVDTSTSNVLTSVHLSTTPPTFDLAANVDYRPAFLQTQDIIRPAGLIQVSCYDLAVIGSPFDTTGTKNEGVALSYSTDSGVTWQGIGLYAQTYQKTGLFQIFSNLSSVQDSTAGTTIRFGVNFNSDAGVQDVAVVAGARLVARRI